MGELTGRRAVVTGGGQGIGRGITERFLEEGARVAIVQRREPDGELLSRDGVRWIAADLARPGAAARVAEAATEQGDGVDVLVNNAGIMFERTLDELDEDEWDRMAALNLRAPVFLLRALLPALRASGHASVVNIGSIEGLASNPLHIAYSATKAGVHGLTRALAVDLGADGIRCNAIAPGWIDTPLSEAYLDGMPDPAEARRRVTELHPLGRTGRPRDIGDAAVFLASDRSSFMTGELVVVDGGRTARLPTPA